MAKRKRGYSKDSNILTALIYIVIGVLFCICRAKVLDWLLTGVGILFIAIGIFDFIRKNIYGGVVSVIIGAIALLGGWLFVEIVMIVFGVLLSVKGIVALMNAVKYKDTVDIIFSILTIVVGFMLIISKWAMVDAFFLILGIMFMINGALEIFGKAFKR